MRWGLVLGFLLFPAFVFANPIIDVLEASKTEVAMPLKSVTAAASKMAVKFHNNENDELAGYSASTGAAIPKLFLFQPYFQSGAGLVPVMNMSLDMSDPFFTALLQGYMDMFVIRADSPYGQHVRARAAQVMKDVPAKFQAQAYANALASFGGNSFAILIQGEVLARKHGANICEILDRNFGLFVLWERNFKDNAPFPGFYWNGSQWVDSKNFIPEADKRAFIKEVLENAWKGDRFEDFKKRYCKI